MKPETRFRLVVVPFLKTLKHTHVFPIQQVTINGTPDLLLCVRGRFVALELKSEKGALSPLQKYNLGEVTRTQGVSLVASPNNWEEIKKILLNLDGGIND